MQIAEYIDGELIYRDATPEEIAALTPPAPTEADIVAAFEDAVDAYLDLTAWLYGYDNLISAITYADEPSVPAFQIEGQAFRAWRSLVWAKCREVLAQYQAGERGAPTTDELISELPDIDLPAPALGRLAEDYRRAAV